VAIPDDFIKKVKLKDFPKSKVKTFDDISMPKSMKCAKCGEHWGCIVNLRGKDDVDRKLETVH
jgi:hypothetical protein